MPSQGISAGSVFLYENMSDSLLKYSEVDAEADSSMALSDTANIVHLGSSASTVAETEGNPDSILCTTISMNNSVGEESTKKVSESSAESKKTPKTGKTERNISQKVFRALRAAAEQHAEGADRVRVVDSADSPHQHSVQYLPSDSAVQSHSSSHPLTTDAVGTVKSCAAPSADRGQGTAASHVSEGDSDGDGDGDPPAAAPALEGEDEIDEGSDAEEQRRARRRTPKYQQFLSRRRRRSPASLPAANGRTASEAHRPSLPRAATAISMREAAEAVLLLAEDLALLPHPCSPPRPATAGSPSRPRSSGPATRGGGSAT